MPDIDETLRDYQQTQQDNSAPDPFGLREELLTIMANAKIVMDTAREVGFTDEQAFQHCRDYVGSMFAAAAAAAFRE